MADDIACLIKVSVAEIQNCHRILDIEDLVRKKTSVAYQELLDALLPEILK